MGSKTEVGFRPVQGQSQLSRQGQAGRRKGLESGKEQVCGQVLARCKSELTLGQRVALPAHGTGQVVTGGPLREPVRKPGVGTKGSVQRACSRMEVGAQPIVTCISGS